MIAAYCILAIGGMIAFTAIVGLIVTISDLKRPPKDDDDGFG